MVWIVILLILGIPLGVIAVAVRSMRVADARWVWWIIWWYLLIVGFCLGIYFSFLEYSTSRYTLRLIGFPMPIVVFELQEGRWIDFPNDAGPLVLGINALAFMIPLLLPLSIVILIRFGIWPKPPEKMRGFPVIPR